MAFLQVNCFSDVLGKCINFHVILPQKTKKQIGVTSNEINEKTTYPVLYLLHGMSDDYTCWMRRTSLERYVSNRNLIVVMPDGDLSWYTNTAYQQKYLTHIAEEIPMICKQFFPQISDKKEDTYIAGLSMGGYGAFKCALTHPQTYGYVAGLSAAFSVNDVLKRNIRQEDDYQYWEGIFGALDQIEHSEHNILLLAESLKQHMNNPQFLPKMYVACGTEDILYATQKEVVNEMIRMGYDITYRERKGIHNWKFWDEEIQHVLNWLPIK